MTYTDYEQVPLKIPLETDDYHTFSSFTVNKVQNIIKKSIDSGNNKIIINTNLKLGIPMENINKIAGPFVEAWAFERFSEQLEDEQNLYKLINVEAGKRLNMADVVLQFKIENKKQSVITGNVDVKATSNDIQNSGKSPNITSFARIRSEYIKNPDYIFIILSIKHHVYSSKDVKSKLMSGVMEIVDCNTYDLKHISSDDLNYNPALGTGQIQIKDIHYVSTEKRSTWEFCQMLDRKCIASKKGFSQWLEYAEQNKWIK